VTAAAWPGRVFEASSSALLPNANPQTRTVQLRLTVPNPDGLLRPGLTASVRLRRSTEESLLIPTLSLIDLGDEKRVITRRDDGSFVPKAVRTGLSGRGETAVAEGLEEGETVVVSGLFLIDSEANLAGALERMRRPEAQAKTESRAESGPEAGRESGTEAGLKAGQESKPESGTGSGAQDNVHGRI
jgi:Cu(I)/Ag(I) efflux system membrane fusion protein